MILPKAGGNTVHGPKNSENASLSATEKIKRAERMTSSALAFPKLGEEMKPANAALRPIHMGLGDIVKQMEAAFRPLTSEMAKFGAISKQIQKAFEPLAASTRFQTEKLTSVNKAIFDVANTVARLHQPITFDLVKVIPKLPDLSNQLTQIQQLHLAFAKIAANDRSIFSPSALKSFAKLGPTIRPFAKDFSVVQGALSKYLAGNEFAASSRRFDHLAIASREYFNSGNLLLANKDRIKLPEETRELRLEKQSEIELQTRTSIEKNLEIINPKLLQLWRGAVKAAGSNNPEKIRHALTSLRALFDHVMDALAPKERINEWSTDPKDFIGKQPTRRARLRFIYSAIDTPEFARFLKVDIDSVLSLYAVFNSGTHGLDPDYSDTQLCVIFRRFEGAICGLIETSFTVANSKTKVESF